MTDALEVLRSREECLSWETTYFEPSVWDKYSGPPVAPAGREAVRKILP